MKIALHDSGEEHLQLMRQLGVEYVVSAVGPGKSGALEVADLVQKKEYYTARGLIWDVIENLSPEIYYKVMLGVEGREEQMDRVCESIRAVGEAGISVLQYQWMLLGGLRTEYSPTGRGGARYPRFDMQVAEQMPAAAMDWLGGGVYPTLPDRPLSAEQVWDNLHYFLQRAVPVAEESGVKLAAHPDDAPVPTYMGVARILVDWEGLQGCVNAVPSPNSGLGFCMGTIGTMADMDVVAAVRHFGSMERIFFAHFRNPRGQVPYFDEVFPDEGDIDMVQAVRAFAEVGFDGVIRIDHCPGVIGDNPSADRSFAFQVGYLQGLMQALESVGT
jgi:mannonate dehydratase